jgi:hypothetical protein
VRIEREDDAHVLPVLEPRENLSAGLEGRRRARAGGLLRPGAGSAGSYPPGPTPSRPRSQSHSHRSENGGPHPEAVIPRLRDCARMFPASPGGESRAAIREDDGGREASNPQRARGQDYLAGAFIA